MGNTPAIEKVSLLSAFKRPGHEVHFPKETLLLFAPGRDYISGMTESDIELLREYARSQPRKYEPSANYDYTWDGD
jgi:hypothetical protein